MIIGFLGNKRVGKDIASNFLINKYNFNRYAFGDPVKDVAKAMFNFSDDQLYGDKKEIIDTRWNITPRRAFQVIGTDFAQYSIYNSLPELEQNVEKKTFWVKRFEIWYQEQIKNNTNINVVLSDVRFQHEIDSIKKLGGIIIKINSNRTTSDNHISENQINNIKSYDYLINNNNDIESFKQEIDKIYRQIV